MPSARFDILHHPNQVQIYVASGIDRKTARTILRRASAGRRKIVRDEPRAFVLFLGREILRNREGLKYAVLDLQTGPAELVYQIDLSRRGPSLKVIEQGKTRYNGFFWSYVGSEVKVRQPRATGNKYKRTARLARFAEAYKKEHGHYPDEAPPANKLVLGKHKVYSARLQKLRDQQVIFNKQFGNIRLGHLRRKMRKKLAAEHAVPAPKKFDIKEHYEVPPDEIK